MSSDQAQRSDGGRPKWIVPLGLFVFLGIVLLLSNHTAEVRSPTGLPVISDAESYNKALGQAEALALGPLQDYEQGKPLTDEQKAAIRQASVLIDTADQFRPTIVNVEGNSSFAPFFLSAKAHAALGEYERADELLRQGLSNAQILKSQGQLTQPGELSVADAHYERSRVLFQTKKYDLAFSEATTAVKDVPNSAEYRVARGMAAMQLGMKDLAKQEMKSALQLNPADHEASMLLKYLSHG